MSASPANPIVRLPVVAVIGASSAPAPVLELAEGVGTALARAGWHLVCGGGEGVMTAAARGFVAARVENPRGQQAIGILPGEDPGWGNPYLDVVIPTGIGWARNAVIVRTAAAVIAVGGCSGTLSEIAFAWQMGRPIVALAGSGGWSERLGGGAIDDRRDDAVLVADSGAAAVALLRPLIDPR